ncbi:MAG: hypothetical protein HOQ05_00865 [Corynebacteriales bacterium]|nr:hypothetical protein [Mycobacteriales bacterium]
MSRHHLETPEFDEGEEIIDESVLLRDDVLIAAMAKGVLPMEYSEDELVHDMLVWRDEICSTPIPENVGVFTEAMLPGEAKFAEAQTQLLPPLLDIKTLGAAKNPRAADVEEPDVDVAIPRQKGEVGPGDAAPHAERGPRKKSGTKDKTRPRTTSTRAARSPRLKRPLAIAAAMVAIALGSLGSMAAATTAQPGSALWPIAKVVDKERAESLEARESAFEQLEDARAQVEKNDTESAREHLDEAIARADSVRGKDGKSELDKEVKSVEARIAAAEGGATNPTTGPSGSSSAPSPTPTPSTPTPTPSPSDSTPSATATPSSPSPTKSS